MSAYKPKPGYTFNPAFGWGRNDKCLCGSGKKFKKCCLLKQGRVVSKAHAKQISLRMSAMRKESS